MMYVWQNAAWPQWRCDFERLNPLLQDLRLEVGRLQGRMEMIGLEDRGRARLETVVAEAIQTSAGLPQLVGLAGKAKSYAERLFLFPAVGPLGALETADALQRPVMTQDVEFTEEALDLIFELTQGYPYFLQEWGYELWNFAESTPITKANVEAATPGIIRKLDENFSG